MKLAMAVGTNRHYVVNTITGRHFVQTGEICGLPKKMVQDVIEEVSDTSAAKIDQVVFSLPAGFPEQMAASISQAAKSRISSLSKALASPSPEETDSN
jgi:serine/threonine-protein kinase HipA